MAISTNGLQLVRLAGAAFNQQLSASDYSEVLAANKTAAELSVWANAAVTAQFKNKTTTDIAKAVLANVGLSSVVGLEAWVAGQLTAGGGVAKAGETLLTLLNDYSNMSTTEAIYGASVATFNTKVGNSQVASQTAGTASGTYAAVLATSAADAAAAAAAAALVAAQAKLTTASDAAAAAAATAIAAATAADTAFTAAQAAATSTAATAALTDATALTALTTAATDASAAAVATKTAADATSVAAQTAFTTAITSAVVNDINTANANLLIAQARATAAATAVTTTATAAAAAKTASDAATADDLAAATAQTALNTAVTASTTATAAAVTAAAASKAAAALTTATTDDAPAAAAATAAAATGAGAATINAAAAAAKAITDAAAAKVIADAAAEKVIADAAAAKAITDAAAAKVIADAEALAKAPVISSLTIGIDTLTGKAGDDVFNAIDAGSTGTTATLTALDAIDGGAGTDTLNISSASAISLPTAATVTNVEKINLASASTVTLNTTTDFAGLTDLTAAGVGAITLVAAAGTNVTATDTAQGAGAISITGGKAVTLTAAATDGGAAVALGNVTIGSTTTKPAGAVKVTVTDTHSYTGSTLSNITVTGGVGATVNSTLNVGADGTAIAANSGATGTNEAPMITVAPTSGAVVINSTVNNKSTTAVTQNAAAMSVTGGSTVTITQTAATVQTATGISTVALGAVSVTGDTTTTSVSVTQTAKDVDGTLAVTTGVKAAVAGTVPVTAVTATPGVTGVTAVTGVVKAVAVALVTGTPIVSNGAVTIADANAGTTVANTITAVTLANYGTSTITSTALNTLNLTGPASTGTEGTSQAGGTLGITEGGSTATIAANKTLTMNLGGGKLGAITDSSNQFSTVNANLTAATTLASFTDTALRTLNIAGTGVLTVTTLNTAVTALTVAGAAGFSGDISSNTGMTSFNGANTTAANTVTMNAAIQSYTGGVGVDTVRISTDALRTISGGGGANVLKVDASATYTADNTRANVSGFASLTTTNATGTNTLDMATMPADVTALTTTSVTGSSATSFTNVASGTTLTIAAPSSTGTLGTTNYTLSTTGGSTKSVTVNLGSSTTDGKTFGTIALSDLNGTGIGTVSLVSNGVNITLAADPAAAKFNTVNITDTGITQLNVSGTSGLKLGSSSYTDAAQTLTINNTNSSTYGLVLPNLIDSSLDTLTFTGTGKTTIDALTNGSMANLTITNSGTGTASVGRIYESTSGTVDTTALTSLTLSGAISLGTKAAPVEIDTTSAAVTISGSTDHAGVALLFAANGYATTVTLGDGNNYVKTTLTTGGGNITTGSGKDWVQQGSLGAATNSSTVSTGAGVDTIVTGVGYSSTVVTKAAGGDGADYIQVQSTATTYNPTHGSAGKYGSVVWTGSQTTGTTVTTGSWTGTLYSESSDTITSSNVIHPTFVTLMSGSLVNANGAGKIFADANIVAPMYGQGAILVASTAKDVFLFQTENTTANDNTTAKGVAAGGSIVQNFKIGTDVIAVTNYQGSGDNLFVGTATAEASINAVTASEALLASSNGWSWALDAGSTTAGVLTYVGAIGTSTPTSANMTIRLVGIQGTITSVDSFFYQG